MMAGKHSLFGPVDPSADAGYEDERSQQAVEARSGGGSASIDRLSSVPGGEA